MSKINYNLLTKLFLKTTGILLCLIFLSFFEPIARNTLTFAITYVQSKVNTEAVAPGYPIEEETPRPAHQKSHAPEPSTMLLIIGGLGGMVVRFAQRSFQKAKRILDIYLAALGLFFASPLIVIAGALTKLTSPGPVFYKQKRVGENHRVFEIYKLRTMNVDAEKKTGAVWAKENDPRITTIGRFLRKTHIDEIPQFINVIKGDMSIVGPRPERPEMVRDLKTLIRDYEKRLAVKPGITGLAQVNHRYDENLEDVKAKINYDLQYIRKMSWPAEMHIMAQTFVVALTGKGAR